ncbi:MAG: phosphotransferase enzyme family protein [Ilumatobacteraceae bacterium]
MSPVDDTAAMSEFASLSPRTQVMRLRAAATEVLAAWPIHLARLRLVFHGYNTTFRVDTTDGRTFALRLNVNSRKTAAGLLAEMSWMRALADDTDVLLPVPQPTIAGDLTAEVAVPSLGRTIPAALFTWLRGPNLEEVADVDHLRALGRTTAVLHTHAEGWSLPVGAELATTDHYWDAAYPMLIAPHETMTDERRSVFAEVLTQVRRVTPLVSATGPHHVLHADLHLGNAKWYRGRLSIFDFDDCLWGVRAHDLAITTYYIQPRRSLVDALFEGYADVRPLPDLPDEHLQTLLAARNLLLIDEMLTNENAELAAIMPRFMTNSEIRHRHFLATGEFRHDLPGVVPLW